METYMPNGIQNGIHSVSNHQRKHRSYGPHFLSGAAVRAWNAAMTYMAGGCTQKEAATAFASNVPYIVALISIIQTEDQDLVDSVLRGERSVLKTAKEVKARAAVVAGIRQLSPADKAAVGRAIGVGAIWDGMVVPAL
jgi:hypothetical protein